MENSTMMNFMNPSMNFSRMQAPMRQYSPLRQHGPQHPMMQNQMNQMKQPMMQNPMMPIGPSFNPMMQNQNQFTQSGPSPYGGGGFGFNANNGMTSGLGNMPGPIGSAYRQGKIQTMF